MLIGSPGDAAPTGRTGEKAHLHEIGLIYIFQGNSLLVTLEDVYEPYLMQMGSYTSSRVTASSLMVAAKVSRPTGPPP